MAKLKHHVIEATRMTCAATCLLFLSVSALAFVAVSMLNDLLEMEP